MINVFSRLLRQKKNFKNGCNDVKFLLNLNSPGRSISRGPLSCQINRNNETPTFNRQLPTLVYIQNPITWLINKIDFKMLKSAWDPEFDEKEFKQGTIQAVSVICTLISKNIWDNLRGLITRQALTRLKKDVETNWSEEQIRNIFLDPCDIKLALPRKVHFLRIADKKFVDVDMMFVGIKFKDLQPSLRNDLVLIELVARFHRNYTLGEIPNWTVTLFKVTRFNGAVPTRYPN